MSGFLLAAVLLAAVLPNGGWWGKPHPTKTVEESWDLDDFDLEAFRFGGTVKVLGIAYGVPETALSAPSTEWSAFGSLRLELEGNPRRWLGYEVHLRLEDDVYSEPFIAALTGVTETGTTLFRGLGKDVELTRSETHRLWAEVDYANVRFTSGKVDVVVGRQAVTFGRSFFWNPTDWLSTFAPTEIDREYKGGVDALRVSYALGRTGGAEVLYAYGEDGEQNASALIGRAFANWHGWDVEVMGGSVLVDTRLGVAFSGDAGGAGVRGEIAWHHPREPYPGDPTSDFLRATVEVDYRWPNSLQLFTELHYNGFGTDDPARYAALFFSPRVVTGQIQNVGRVYAGSQISYELTPLLTVAAAVLVNLDDRSGLVNPTVTYSLSDESNLVAGALVPWGAEPDGAGPRSEYGSYFTTLWVQWRWSF